MTRTDSRRSAVESVRKAASQAPDVRQELAKIIASPAFRSSPRSQEFLQHVVEKALEGSLDDLKERIIGADLFGRAADYDTGADSIVRVVANETRRRLTEYRHDQPGESRVRIELAAGSYLPSFQIGEPASTHSVSEPAGFPAPSRARTFWIGAAVLALAVCCVWLAWQNRSLRTQLAARVSPASDLPPWSALFGKGRGIHIILADTSIGGVQNILKSRLSLSDYVNRNYFPAGVALKPELAGFLKFLMSNQYTSASYSTTAIRIAQLAQANGAPVNVSFAREMSLRTIKDGENFVILGTARANPWAQLIEDRLNFHSEFGNSTDEPTFENRAPRAGELKKYVPANLTPSLSESYGLVAFLPSVFQGGHILFVAGTSSQGTEGAGEFLTDLSRLEAELSKIGLKAGAPPRGFELLLRAKHTAGAPVRSEVVAHRIF
jgi:hypothetical protein